MPGFERRRSDRELPKGPAQAPDPPIGTGGLEVGEGLVDSLRQHPGLFHHSMIRLREELAPVGKAGGLVGNLFPILAQGDELWEAPRPGPGEEALVLGVSPARGGKSTGALAEAWRELAESLGGRLADKDPPRSLGVLVRIRRELAKANYWVACGALGLGLPLAWATLAETLVAVIQRAPQEFPEALRAIFVSEEESERARLVANLEALAPVLHDPEVATQVHLGAERLLDGWQVMWNGLETRAHGGGPREL